MKRNEDHLQADAVRIFRLIYPKYVWRFFAIPNGGKRNKVVAMRLKQQGVLSGVFDLFLSVPCGKYHGLFLETKYGKNKLTDNQVEFMKQNCKDYAFAVYYNQAEFLEILESYFKGEWENKPI